MNPQTLVKLASEDNSTLCYLVNRWMVNAPKANPIPAAQKRVELEDTLAKVLKFNKWLHHICWISFAYSAVTHVGLKFPKLPYVETVLSAKLVSSILFLLFAVIYLVRSIRMNTAVHEIDHQSSTDEGRNLKRFCDAVTFVEKIVGAPLLPATESKLEDRSIWHSGSSSHLAAECLAHFKARATEIKRLQGIAWRSEEAQEQRQSLIDDLDLVHKILLIDKSLKPLFRETEHEAVT